MSAWIAYDGKNVSIFTDKPAFKAWKRKQEFGYDQPTWNDNGTARVLVSMYGFASFLSSKSTFYVKNALSYGLSE